MYRSTFLLASLYEPLYKALRFLSNTSLELKWMLSWLEEDLSSTYYNFTSYMEDGTTKLASLIALHILCSLNTNSGVTTYGGLHEGNCAYFGYGYDEIQ